MKDRPTQRETVPVRLYINPEYLDRLREITRSHGLSLSRLVNASIAVSIRHREELVKDAKGVEQTWHETQS